MLQADIVTLVAIIACNKNLQQLFVVIQVTIV